MTNSININPIIAEKISRTVAEPRDDSSSTGGPSACSSLFLLLFLLSLSTYCSLSLVVWLLVIDCLNMDCPEIVATISGDDERSRIGSESSSCRASGLSVAVVAVVAVAVVFVVVVIDANLELHKT